MLFRAYAFLLMILLVHFCAEARLLMLVVHMFLASTLWLLHYCLCFFVHMRFCVCFFALMLFGCAI